jgi:phospholipase C
VAYDEHGGFFDHMAPSTAPDDRAADGFNQLGFRVPSLVIGPYARAGYVSSVTREHTSCLRHIEKTFSLEALTVRDAAANDLGECIDADRQAAGMPAAPIQLPAVEIDESMLPESCNHGADLGKPDHDIVFWAEAEPAKFGALDRRRYAEDDVHTIAAYLDRFGLGRIRKSR